MTFTQKAQELMDEIESTRAVLQTYLPSDRDIDKMPSSEIMEFALSETDDRMRDTFLIRWKDYKFLLGKKLGRREDLKDFQILLKEKAYMFEKDVEEEISQALKVLDGDKHG